MLATELLDLIMQFLDTTNRLDRQTLLACTNVSSTFWNIARVYLFRHLCIPVASIADGQTLQALLEDSPYSIIPLINSLSLRLSGSLINVNETPFKRFLIAIVDASRLSSLEIYGEKDIIHWSSFWPLKHEICALFHMRSLSSLQLWNISAFSLDLLSSTHITSLTTIDLALGNMNSEEDGGVAEEKMRPPPLKSLITDNSFPLALLLGSGSDQVDINLPFPSLRLLTLQLGLGRLVSASPLIDPLIESQIEALELKPTTAFVQASHAIPVQVKLSQLTSLKSLVIDISADALDCWNLPALKNAFLDASGPVTIKKLRLILMIYVFESNGHLILRFQGTPFNPSLFASALTHPNWKSIEAVDVIVRWGVVKDAWSRALIEVELTQAQKQGVETRVQSRLQGWFSSFTKASPSAKFSVDVGMITFE